MKRLIIAGLVLCSFGANASNVGVNNSSALRGNVNLECNSPNGDILEVASYSFPQQVQIQSEYLDLKSVKSSQGWKAYLYKQRYSSLSYALLVKGRETVIQDQNNINYECK